MVVERSGHWVRWVIGGLVILGLLGGGYFAYSRGYLKKIGLAPNNSNSAVVNNAANGNRSAGSTSGNDNRAVNAGSLVSNSSTTISPVTTNIAGPTNGSTTTTSLDGRPVAEQYVLASCYITAHPDVLDVMPKNGLDDSLKDFVTTKPKDMGCDKYTAADIEATRPLLTTDADGDGVVLINERHFGSSDAKKDTDGDGHDDLTEILNNYNPNGPGKL